ncbi:MAG: nickel insertion protein, partial [Vicinamibacterales bacterium]
MKVLYFDAFSGISGDMVLGAFLDAGLPLEDLRAALGSLAVDRSSVDAERVLRAGVSATRFRVNERPSESALAEQPSARRSRTAQPDVHAHAHVGASTRLHAHDDGDCEGHTHSRV